MKLGPSSSSEHGSGPVPQRARSATWGAKLVGGLVLVAAIGIGAWLTARSGSAIRTGGKQAPASVIYTDERLIEEFYSDAARAEIEHAVNDFGVQARQLGLEETECREAQAELSAVLSLMLEPSPGRYRFYLEQRGRELPPRYFENEKEGAAAYSLDARVMAGSTLGGNAKVRLLCRRGGQVAFFESPRITARWYSGQALDTAAEERTTAIEVVYQMQMRDGSDQLQPAAVGIVLGTSKTNPRWQIFEMRIYQGPQPKAGFTPPL